MKVPNLEDLIDQGEQQALLDLGYEHVVWLVESLQQTRNKAYPLGSTDLHGAAGLALSTGRLEADSIGVIYDAIRTVLDTLRVWHQHGGDLFSAAEWHKAATVLSRRLDNSTH